MCSSANICRNKVWMERKQRTGISQSRLACFLQLGLTDNHAVREIIFNVFSSPFLSLSFALSLFLSLFRFVLAIVDSGACVSLMGVSIFYRRCPATTLYLASYAATPSGAEPTALVPVTGTCVPHSQSQSGTAPRMHCNAEGEWMVPVGGCTCDAGYEPNNNGSACLGKFGFTEIPTFLVIC